MISDVIEVRSLNKSFPGNLFAKPRQVLFDVTFNVKAGRTTGFVGVNGSGKTTTFKCLLGFIKAQSGQVQLLGESGASAGARARIGYLPERPYLYEFLTAREFLKFHWDLTGGGADFEKVANDLLDRVGLSAAADRRIRAFSKGMMQRIGFAQALLRDPELLLLDEPMSGLDPDGRFLMKSILREEKSRGRSIFFSSHYLSDVEELCEDLVIIDQGRVKHQGSTSELLASHQGSFQILYVDGHGLAGEARCSTDELDATLRRLQKDGAKITNVVNDFVALESAFKSLRGERDSGS